MPATRTTISVVIPVKDDGTELARCLRSLSAQSRPPDEIIVVDNGSSDRSAEIAAAAGATVIGCDHPGIPAASSRGYDRAGGDLILRLDADCVAPVEWVRDVEAAFAGRPGVAAFTGGALFFDGPPRLRRSLARVYLFGYMIATAPALGHLPLFGSNLAMRHDAWLAVRARVHRDDPEVHDDLDLAFHLGLEHRVGYLRSAPMGISMRPFSSPRGFARRIYRGFRTVVVHWPLDFPPLRWLRIAVYARRTTSPRPCAPADAVFAGSSESALTGQEAEGVLEDQSLRDLDRAPVGGTLEDDEDRADDIDEAEGPLAEADFVAIGSDPDPLEGGRLD